MAAERILSQGVMTPRSMTLKAKKFKFVQQLKYVKVTLFEQLPVTTVINKNNDHQFLKLATT
jgi:hypothetical protein